MKIFIPTPLRQYAGGQNAVEIEAATVAEAMDMLTENERAELQAEIDAEGTEWAV